MFCLLAKALLGVVAVGFVVDLLEEDEDLQNEMYEFLDRIGSD